MKRSMDQVEVYVSESGNVCIKQMAMGMDDAIIALHPDQVDIVIRWLQETKEEALEMENQSEEE